MNVTERKPRRRLLRRHGLTTLHLSAEEPPREPTLLSPELEITETDILLQRLPAGFDGLKVVHLTDIHHSLLTPLEDVEHAVHLANRMTPDVVALTGDYVTLSSAYIRPVAKALGKLRARLGVFAVLGNHDFQVDADETARALEGQGISMLRNTHRALRGRGGGLWLLGVDDLWWQKANLENALKHVPTNEVKILLCHNPLGIYWASKHKIDLVLSGHTHGGQVRLPVVGSLRGRSKLGKRFIEGWNRLDGTQIYISRGIGKVLLPVRFGCPPEIACLRLRSVQ